MEKKESNTPDVLIVPENLHGKRLGTVVKNMLDISWGKAQEWIERGKISIHGKVVIDHAVTVNSGTEIVFRMDAPKQKAFPNINPDVIVYMDTHVIVVNKPAGIITAPSDEEERNERISLMHSLQKYLASQTKGGKRHSALPSVLVVHRLDKGTSGILVFARTMDASKHLKYQFFKHSVIRRYFGIAHGRVEADTITSHLVPNRGDGIRGSLEKSPIREARRARFGKIAITHVEPVEYYPDATLVSCRLETGRTNQIRVHLSESGHPIIGDNVYIRNFEGTEIKAPRLMLHAEELGFVHPVTEELLHFQAPLPDDMQRMITRLKQGLKKTKE